MHASLKSFYYLKVIAGLDVAQAMSNCPRQLCGGFRFSSRPTSCTGRGASTTARSSTSWACRGTATRCSRLTASPSSKRPRTIAPPEGRGPKRFRNTRVEKLRRFCTLHGSHREVGRGLCRAMGDRIAFYRCPRTRLYEIRVIE